MFDKDFFRLALVFLAIVALSIGGLSIVQRLHADKAPSDSQTAAAR